MAGLSDYLLGMDLGRDESATAIMMRQQESALTMERIRRAQELAMAQRQYLYFHNPNDFHVWSPKPRYRLRKLRNGFIGRFRCGETDRVYTLTADEKPAVERGMAHFVNKWDSALSHLRSAGLAGDELIAPLAVLYEKFAAEAARECDLELGVRHAERRARELLLMCLNERQRGQFERDESFQIYIPDHKLKGFPFGDFVIRKGSAFNVEHKESGEKFCVVAKEKVPVYDQMLTQKLLLENEPKRFFETANRSAGGGLVWFDEYTNMPQHIFRNYFQFGGGGGGAGRL